MEVFVATVVVVVVIDICFIVETVKYLYLIFDDENWVTRGNFIFNTEAHIFPVLYKFMEKSRASKHQNMSPLSCAIPWYLKEEIVVSGY